MFNPAVVPKDVWNIIAHDLKIKDLLSLRAVSQRLNEIVVQMQSRWYRAQQWLVAQNAPSKVKAHIRVHDQTLTYRCVPQDFDFPGRETMGFPKGYIYNWQQRERLYTTFTKLIEDGQFPEEKCACRWHWSIKIPKSELDIPLDKHFKPKQNNYIYQYLIQCYRKNQPRHSAKIDRLNENIRNTKRNIEHAKRTIEKGEINLKVWQEDLEKQSKHYKDNQIFAGYKINGYKTPAQQRRAQEEAEKQAKQQSKKLEAESKRKTKRPKG